MSPPSVHWSRPKKLTVTFDSPRSFTSHVWSIGKLLTTYAGSNNSLLAPAPIFHRNHHPLYPETVKYLPCWSCFTNWPFPESSPLDSHSCPFKTKGRSCHHLVQHLPMNPHHINGIKAERLTMAHEVQSNPATSFSSWLPVLRSQWYSCHFPNRSSLFLIQRFSPAVSPAWNVLPSDLHILTSSLHSALYSSVVFVERLSLK